MIAKTVFLTHSQANHLTFDLLKERLLSSNVAVYVFSHENHKLPPEDDNIDYSDNDSEGDDFEGIEPQIIEENDENDEFMIFDENDEDSENKGGSVDENEGGGIHFHYYLECIEKKDIRDPRYFEIVVEHYNEELNRKLKLNTIVISNM